MVRTYDGFDGVRVRHALGMSECNAEECRGDVQCDVDNPGLNLNCKGLV